MSQKISQQPLASRFEHLVKVISGERFLQMKGLNNDLPFYICEFKAAEALEMERLRRQLINTLESTTVGCLSGRGVKVLDINLYDLCIQLLQVREGSTEGSRLWDEVLEVEHDVEKDSLLELLQNVLSIEDYLIPAIGERIQQSDFDVLFLSGIGEVFPYIRSHNVLNNLQSVVVGRPMLMFFPGRYEQSDTLGSSLVLFGRLKDDQYYRAKNILEQEP